MALKDWKKVGNGNHFWFIKDNYRLTLTNSGAHSWEVLLEYKSHERLKKHFKTKSQAIKFVKLYMRKH